MSGAGKRVLVLFAQGFEEIELVTIVDVLRRAELDVVTASLLAGAVQGSHGITILADAAVEDVRAADFDAVVLPGGMENARTLASDPRFQDLIRAARKQGRVLGAICAAPVALQSAGVLGGEALTSHPSVEKELPQAQYRQDRVVRDGNLITSRGPGTALEFALALVEKLLDGSRAAALARPMLARTAS